MLIGLWPVTLTTSKFTHNSQLTNSQLCISLTSLINSLALRNSLITTNFHFLLLKGGFAIPMSIGDQYASGNWGLPIVWGRLTPSLNIRMETNYTVAPESYRDQKIQITNQLCVVSCEKNKQDKLQFVTFAVQSIL